MSPTLPKVAARPHRGGAQKAVCLETPSRRSFAPRNRAKSVSAVGRHVLEAAYREGHKSCRVMRLEREKAIGSQDVDLAKLPDGDEQWADDDDSDDAA